MGGGVLVRFRRSRLRLKEDELVRGRSQARSRRRGGGGGGGGGLEMNVYEKSAWRTVVLSHGEAVAG